MAKAKKLVTQSSQPVQSELSTDAVETLDSVESAPVEAAPEITEPETAAVPEPEPEAVTPEPETEPEAVTPEPEPAAAVSEPAIEPEPAAVETITPEPEAVTPAPAPAANTVRSKRAARPITSMITRQKTAVPIGRPPVSINPNLPFQDGNLSIDMSAEGIARMQAMQRAQRAAASSKDQYANVRRATAPFVNPAPARNRPLSPTAQRFAGQRSQQQQQTQQQQPAAVQPQQQRRQQTPQGAIRSAAAQAARQGSGFKVIGSTTPFDL